MSEGEFRKRIQDRITWLIDIADGNTPPCAELRADELKDVLGWLDEAAKDFPTYGIGKTATLSELDLRNKIDDWLLKWFGDNRVETPAT